MTIAVAERSDRNVIAEWATVRRRAAEGRANADAVCELLLERGFRLTSHTGNKRRYDHVVGSLDSGRWAIVDRDYTWFYRRTVGPGARLDMEMVPTADIAERIRRKRTKHLALATGNQQPATEGVSR